MNAIRIKEILRESGHFESVFARKYTGDEKSVYGVIGDDDWLAVDILGDGEYYIELESSRISNEGFADEGELERELEKRLSMVADVFD